MNKFLLSVALATSIFTSCTKKSTRETLKEELKSKKQSLSSLEKEIRVLQTKIESFDTLKKNHAIPVKVDTLGHSEYSNMVTLQGLIHSDQNIRISSEVAGVVTKIRVKEGENIQSGQILIDINNDLINAQIHELQTALDLAKITFEKQERLWKKNIGSEMQYLQAKTNYESLKRRMISTEIQLSKHKIIAQSSGQIEQIFVKTGQVASPGIPLLEITNNQELELHVKVSEQFLGKFTPGQNVMVRYPSISKQYEEKIDAIGSVIDPNSRRFLITIRPKNGKGLLKPNLLALIDLPSFNSANALSIPTKLIRQDSKGNFVLCVNENSAVEKAYLEIKEQFADRTIVKSGIEPGKLIITEGFTNVIPGDFVKIISSKAIQ
ncbi:MAG: efflux RND transporter periplasmic adaptor subunit [Bacteroidota bacterium]|nr:efflux RND transporter periplasmic adaptor subunit [Bacteroidota bacterium]